MSEYEIAVLSRLFDVEFQGKIELQEQVKNSTVSLMETNDNYGSLKFRIISESVANVKERVPVMALTRDAGGGPVEILLHVIDGKIDELEFVRMDGEPMHGLPRLDILQAYPRGGESERTISFPEL